MTRIAGSLIWLTTSVLITQAAVALPTQVNQYETQMLLASDREFYDGFGRSIAVVGDTALISAPVGDGPVRGTGSVYEFRLNGGRWSQTAELFASDGASLNYFGASLALQSDTAVIAAPNSFVHGFNSGSMYVFNRDSGGVWHEEEKVAPADGAQNDYFGSSVALDGDRIVVGAFGDDDTVGSDSGAAYIYRRDGGAWIQTAKLLASDKNNGDQFGTAARISGKTAIIGAYTDNGAGRDAGGAYIFQEDALGNWAEVVKLTASDAQVEGYFGFSLAIEGSLAVVGSPGSGNPNARTGAVYTFQETQPGVWQEIDRLVSQDAFGNGGFGSSLALQGDLLLVAGGSVDGPAPHAGTVHVFRRSSSGGWTPVIELVVERRSTRTTLVRRSLWTAAMLLSARIETISKRAWRITTT